MSDIVFVTPTLSSSLKHEINGTLLLGTFLLQEGFDVRIVRFSEIEGYNVNYAEFIQNITDKLIEAKPKCVSFYSIWNTYHITQRLCREIKRRDPNIITVLGGPHSSLLARRPLCKKTP